MLEDLLKEAFLAEEKESEESNSKNYAPIREFIVKLFEPDDDAMVNCGAWCAPLSSDECYNENSPWLEQFPATIYYVRSKKSLN